LGMDSSDTPRGPA